MMGDDAEAWLHELAILAEPERITHGDLTVGDVVVRGDDHATVVSIVRTDRGYVDVRFGPGMQCVRVIANPAAPVWVLR